VKRFGPGKTANFGNLIPVLAFIISYFMLDEQLFGVQFLGAAVTVVGVWIARR
jgi:drug/metabolite transporter (DMT)-like permease